MIIALSLIFAVAVVSSPGRIWETEHRKTEGETMNERSGRGKTKHPDEGVFAFGAETISFRVDYGIYCRIETAEKGRSPSFHIRQEP